MIDCAEEFFLDFVESFRMEAGIFFENDFE